MQIETGLQPNCSELIIRLNETDINKVTEELKSIGIKEFLIKDYSLRWTGHILTEWDEAPDANVVDLDTLPKEVVESLKQLKDYGQDEKDSKKAIKILEKAGIDISKTSIELLDQDNPGMTNGNIRLSEDFDGDGIAIVGHQHCCSDMFPTLKKISDHFGSEVYPYDGGSIEDYNQWLESNGEIDE